MGRLACPIVTAPVATIKITAPLAQYLAGIDGKPHGIRRLQFKAMRALFFLRHQTLGQKAAAELVFAAGLRVAVNCANTAFVEYARCLRSDGIYEKEVSSLLAALAPSLAHVYDIGANWGYFSVLLAADPAFRGQVDAFEIKPATFRDLESCIVGAGLSGRVRCHAHGLSDREGTVRLSRERHSALSRILPATAVASGDPVVVRPLDALSLPPPDLIKLDVEGHEAAVLAGGLELIRQAQPFIVLESWDRPDDLAAMTAPLDLLEAEGYGLYRLTVEEAWLRLDSMTAAQRPGMPGALNLLAVPKRRIAQLESAFAR